MSFTRIWDREQQARERALDRYVALIQQERDWTAAEEAEARELATRLEKSLEDMAEDRSVVAHARTLQVRMAAGEEADGKKAAAQQAVSDFDEETKRLVADRRARRHRLYCDASALEHARGLGWKARQELKKLMQRHPLLLGHADAIR